MDRYITIFVLIFFLVLIIHVRDPLSCIKKITNKTRILAHELFISERFTSDLTFSSFMRYTRLSGKTGIRNITNNDYINKSKILADKFRIKEKLADIPYLHTAKILGVYKNSEKIDFNKLPNKFVIKVNHWSGDSLIVNKTKSLSNVVGNH